MVEKPKPYVRRGSLTNPACQCANGGNRVCWFVPRKSKVVYKAFRPLSTTCLQPHHPTAVGETRVKTPQRSAYSESGVLTPISPTYCCNLRPQSARALTITCELGSSKAWGDDAQALLRLCSGSAHVRSPLTQVKAAAAHVWRLETEIARMRLESDFRGRNTRKMAFDQEEDVRSKLVLGTRIVQTGLGEAG
jgi:hypothetical protein